jgi:hypothetical protein
VGESCRRKLITSLPHHVFVTVLTSPGRSFLKLAHPVSCSSRHTQPRTPLARNISRLENPSRFRLPFHFPQPLLHVDSAVFPIYPSQPPASSGDKQCGKQVTTRKIGREHFAQIFCRVLYLGASSSRYSDALPQSRRLSCILGSLPWFALSVPGSLAFQGLHLDYPQLSVEAQG